MITREDIWAAVCSTFPPDSRSRVMSALDRYGVESYERERERVQLAIVKLSAGSEEKLGEFTAVAKHDYRDVLFWVDNPDEAKLTPEKRQAMVALLKKFGVEPPVGWMEDG